MAVAAAYPFIDVTIDTSALAPVAQRATGVIAVVGKTASGAAGGSAAVNVPQRVSTLSEAASLFAKVSGDTVTETPLFRSLRLALGQSPRPTKVYGVRSDGDKYAAALASLEAVDDVSFVVLAEESAVGTAATNDAPATSLMALKQHVESMSSQGQKRLGVGMIDGTTAKSPTYVGTVSDAVKTLRSDSSRMVMLAARGASGDVATAGAAAMAAYPPHASIVLKRVRGITIPPEQQYGPSEISALSELGLIPIIDPALIVGESLHFAEGRCFTSDAELLYVDIVRTLDDIDFRLKAGLIGTVGDARITRAGMTLVKERTDAILAPLVRGAVIDDYGVTIPVLDVLSLPESSWAPADKALVKTARENRTVEMLVSVTYGPAVHRLRVTLAPKF